MTYMDPNSEELYTIIDRAIDEAMLNGRFLFNMKSYLTGNKWTRKQTKELIDSSSMVELTQVVDELSQYIARDKYMSEAYGNVPKPQARKIRKYFETVINDAKEYYEHRRPGRPKKPAK